jgi:hypothetical protein
MELAVLGLQHFLNLILNHIAYLHLLVMLLLTTSHALASSGSCIGTTSFFEVSFMLKE